MALTVYLPLRAAMGLGTSAHPTITAPETATSTFKIGALLVYSSGYVAEAGSDPTAVCGVAVQPGNNAAADSTANLSKYVPAIPSLVFEGQLTTSSGAYTMLITDIGSQFGVAKDSTSGYWYIDHAETTDKVVTIVAPKDPIGTVDGRVYFVFNYVKTAFYST